MLKMQWGPANKGVIDSKTFESALDLIAFANTMTDNGDYVVIIDDEIAYGDTIADAVTDLVYLLDLMED